MKNNKPKFIAFMNSYTQGASGGDIASIELAKRIKGFDIIVVTSLLGKKLCIKKGLKPKFIITTRETRFCNVILTYLKRIIKSLFIKINIKDNDILFGTSDCLPDVLPLLISKIKNRNACWVQKFYHFMPNSRRLSYLSQKFSLILIKKYADLIITSNSFSKEKLINLGFKENIIYISYPGIDLHSLTSIKPDKKRYDAIFMGQLRPQKGIFDLPRIWRLVCNKRKNSKLGIIGSGSSKIYQKLEYEIRLNNLENNIDILGYIPGSRAFSIIKSAKVFIFPSHEEGFGIAPLEAQACGLPVVAWDLEIYNEIFPEGLIKIKINDLEKFADAVTSILDNTQFYKELSYEARINAEKFDIDTMARIEIDLIKKATFYRKKLKE